MKVGKLSAKRKLLLGAVLASALAPALAQDAQIKDLTAIAGSVDSLKTAKDKQAVVAAVKKHYGEKLAQDADLDGVIQLLDALGSDDDEDAPITMDDDEGLAAAVAGCTPEIKAKIKALMNGGGAMDDADPVVPAAKPAAIDKPAMDAAIAAATKAAETATVVRMNAIHQALREVEPLIGAVAIAQDSAENVYKLALDAAAVDLTGVHPSAYKAMVGMLPKAGAQPVTRVTLAQDSAGGAKSFADMFPGASKMKGGV